MNQVKQDKLYKAYLIFLGTLVLLPIVAPVLLHFGLDAPAKLIYFIYSFTCHQFNTRSLYLFDQQFAWCARDTGIWFGWFTAAVLLYKGYLKNIKWYWTILLVLPMLLDGGTQTIFTFEKLGTEGKLIGDIVYSSNNLVRFMTGSLFGIGVGLWFSNQLLSDQYGYSTEFLSMKEKGVGDGNLVKDSHFHGNDNNRKLLTSNAVRIFLSYLVLVIFYFTLIQFWSLTSSRVEPTNIFDSKPKVQSEDFFARRKDGACPTTNADLLNLECFF